LFSKVGSTFNNFFHQYLPFPLTNAQKRVLKEIRQEYGKWHTNESIAAR